MTKAFDIIPPKKVSFLPKKKEVKIKKPKKISPRRPIYILCFLLLVGVIFHFAFQKAEIEIWPEGEALSFKTGLTITSSINDEEPTIKGEVFEEKSDISRVFYASGVISKERKAEGVIRVYNAYSTRSQILVENTRFVSVDGKLFRLIKRSTIPGGHYEDNKLIPGHSDLEVRADQAGPEYNIEASTFSIPGFAGTAMYTAFYGRSFQPMKNGFKGETSQVTQEDLDRAEDTLIEALEEKNIVSLKEKASSFVFSEEFLEHRVLDSFSLVKVGAELKSFDYQVEMKSKALLFQKVDLDGFVSDFLLPLVPEDKELHQESLEVNFSPLVADLALEEIALSLEITAKAYSGIDESVLKQELKGKSLSESKTFLDNQEEIKRVLVKTSPFWIRSIPKNEKRIRFKLILD